ncbi:MAG: hypothetical protein ABFC71_02335 [Methanoregula sp.]
MGITCIYVMDAVICKKSVRMLAAIAHCRNTPEPYVPANVGVTM